MNWLSLITLSRFQRLKRTIIVYCYGDKKRMFFVFLLIFEQLFFFKTILQFKIFKTHSLIKKLPRFGDLPVTRFRAKPVKRYQTYPFFVTKKAVRLNGRTSISQQVQRRRVRVFRVSMTTRAIRRSVQDRFVDHWAI